MNASMGFRTQALCSTGGTGGLHGRDETPVLLGRFGSGSSARSLRDLRALVNPGANQFDLRRRQRLCAERHPGEAANSC